MLVKEEQRIVIPREQAVKYLQVYNADIDWNSHLTTLHQRLNKKHDEDTAKSLMRKQIACTILLPYYDHSSITDPPENLLYWCSTYRQFETRDWTSELMDVWTKDEKIEEVRNECLELGIIYPIEYNPNTRQALSWLKDSAELSGDINDLNRDAVIKRLQNLVFAYGGVVVCSIYQKPELKNKISNILNWRSGYFFERLIHETYKPNEIIKIKQLEINKLRTANSKLVKKVKG